MNANEESLSKLKEELTDKEQKVDKRSKEVKARAEHVTEIIDERVSSARDEIRTKAYWHYHGLLAGSWIYAAATTLLLALSNAVFMQHVHAFGKDISSAWTYLGSIGSTISSGLVGQLIGAVILAAAVLLLLAAVWIFITRLTDEISLIIAVVSLLCCIYFAAWIDSKAINTAWLWVFVQPIGSIVRIVRHRV